MSPTSSRLVSVRTRADRGAEHESAAKFIGESRQIRELRDLIERVAPTDSTVLITGETGTGKEVVAGLLHRMNGRRRGRLVCVNCAAIPDSLVEDELFGHESGAFTGADHPRIGAFEAADGGTLFLDEIGDMSSVAQAKMLRTLEDGSLRRVGAQRQRSVNVRVVAATNRPLEELIDERRFRRDLYFRLNVVQLGIPPLREHKEDLGLLTEHFLDLVNGSLGRRVRRFTRGALNALYRHDWPGNVRELKNVIEGTIVALTSDIIDFPDLPASVRRRSDTTRQTWSERDQLISALHESRWNKSRAARRLGWSRMTVYRKMAKYDLVSPAKPAPRQ